MQSLRDAAEKAEVEDATRASAAAAALEDDELAAAGLPAGMRPSIPVPKQTVYGLDDDISVRQLEKMIAKAGNMASRVNEEDRPCDEPAEDQDAGELVRIASATTMSFVGFYKDTHGYALSKQRIFSSSGESHGVSRSIGDRNAARGCVATPAIKTVAVAAGGVARIVVCSDGVWDCYTSAQVSKAISGINTVSGAAKSLCVKARHCRVYGGMALDDITVVVVDIGGSSPVGGEPRCGLGCVIQ